MKKGLLIGAALLAAVMMDSAARAETLVVQGATTFGMGKDAVGEIAGLQFFDYTPGWKIITGRCQSETTQSVSICAAKIDLEDGKITKIHWAKQVLLNPKAK